MLLIWFCFFRRTTTGLTGFYVATSLGHMLVMLALLLRLVAVTMRLPVYVFVFSLHINVLHFFRL